MSGNVTNILFSNLNLQNTERGPRIKSCVGRGGMVSNITYDNIKFNNIDTAISISQFYSSNDCDNQDSKKNVPIFKDFTFKNLKGTVTGDAGDLQCLSQLPCQNIVLENINITKYKDGFKCQYVYGSSHDVSPPSCVKSEQPYALKQKQKQK